MITDAEGKQVVGDKLTETVTGRQRQWMKELNQQAMAQAMRSTGMGAGAVSPDAGRMMGLIQSTAAQLNAKFQQTLAAYHQSGGQVDSAYDADLGQIDARFDKKKQQGGCYGTTPTYTVDCKALDRQWNAAILKAGDTYLGKLAVPFGDLKRDMKGIATQAQSVLDQAGSAFGSHPPVYVFAIEHQLISVGMMALASVNSSENDAVVHVYRKSVEPVLDKTGKPHL